MPYIPDPINEIAALYAWEERQQRIESQLADVTPDQAFRVALFGKHMPWVPAGVALPMGLEGFTPSDPLADMVSRQSLLTNNPYQPPGTLVSPAQMFPGAHNRNPRTLSPKQSDLVAGAQSPDDTKLRNQLVETGFVPVHMMQLDPGLATLIQSASSLIGEDGFIHAPSNLNTPKGRAWTKLRTAFSDAGVRLPFYNDDGRPAIYEPRTTKPEDRQRIVDIRNEYNSDPELANRIIKNYQRSLTSGGSITYIDEELFPEPDTGTSGGGSMPGWAGGLAAPARRATGTSTDPRRQMQIDAMGLPFQADDPMGSLQWLGQPAFIAMDAPQQELQGVVRNIIAANNGRPVDWTESQSDLGVMIAASRDGRPISAGDGFFVDPDSQVARERRAREAKRGQIGGHNITLGRFLADTVTEPDTTPFNLLSGTVDAGVALADPTAYALSKAGKIRVARDLFAPAATNADAGLIAGFRRAIHGPTADTWLNGKDGIKAIDALTNETSASRIWIAMNRRVDPRLAARFARARTSDETRKVLEDVIGTQIRKPSELEAATPRLSRDPMLASLNRLNPRTSQSRMLRWMPTDQLDTEDPRQFATQLERHMINAGVPEHVQEEVINEIANSVGRNGLYTAATKAMKHEAGILTAMGIHKDQASRLTRLFQTTFDSELQGLVDEVGEDVPVWEKMLVGGGTVDVPGPHLPLEHINRYIPLPDARAIRRLTSNKAMRFLTTNRSPETFGQNRFPVALLDFVTQDIWKTGTLLGRFPAWITRVVGESQVRMAAGGLDSMFRHPIDYFGWALGRKGTLSPSGIALDDVEEFQRSLTATHGGWLSRPGVTMSNKARLFRKAKADPIDFKNAWADQLTLLSYDPVARRVLNEGIDNTKAWMLGTFDGHRIRRDLMQAHPGNLMDEAGIERYLHTVSRRISIMTGGNTEIIDAIKTGKITAGGKDVPIFINTTRTNPKFTDWLDSRLDASPEAVKGFDYDVRRGGVQFPERWNQAVDRMFAMTMGFADNMWDRAPTFKQFLWQHTREMIGFASPNAQKRILANARKANVPSRVLRSLERAAKHSSGDLGASELDMLARGYAADSAKRLLYDLAERGQLADAMRIIAPFGNAYQEIFGAWSKLLNDVAGPGIGGKALGFMKFARRTQQGIEAARGEDFGSVVGAPSGEGFFFKDEFGEEVFVIPGSQFLTQSLTGVPVPLTGSVQGLNMMGNIVPGLGPVAAIPAAWMMQDKPEFAGIHDLLLPYGAPGERTPSDMTQMLNYAPPWMRRTFDAFTNGGYDQRQWMNAQKDTMAYLYSTGEYDTSTREGMQELLKDAKEKTRALYFIRGFAQSFSPTTPAYRWLVEDKSGTLLATAVLTEDYYEMQEEDYETAGQRFMEKYGEDAILAIIPQSGASTYGIPRNQQQYNFVLNNPEVKELFPSTYGFFLPQTDDFDYDIYLKSFLTGEREDLSAEQWLNLANSMQGDMMYRHYTRQLGGRTDRAARDYMRQVRQKIDEMYPVGPTGLPKKPETADMVRELTQAVDNPAILRTDAGKGLELYLQYRAQALERAAQMEHETSSGLLSSSRELEPVRMWLHTVAQKVMEKHPDFSLMFDIVFSREIELTDESVAAMEEAA